MLVDQNEQKLASEVQDPRDAVAYMPHRVTVRGGDFSDLGVCDVIVNSVGKIDLLRGTHDRVTEMDFTIPAVRGYAEKIKASGFDGVLINITNPATSSRASWHCIWACPAAACSAPARASTPPSSERAGAPDRP